MGMGQGRKLRASENYTEGPAGMGVFYVCMKDALFAMKMLFLNTTARFSIARPGNPGASLEKVGSRVCCALQREEDLVTYLRESALGSPSLHFLPFLSS